jgi:two-component system chemotaxis response regulator CheY
MKHRSVLIVDDSATMRRAVRRLFETSGWEVVGEAENGKQGVQMAEALQPAVVTLDVAMPVMNGIDAAKQLIADVPHIQLIMCTAYGDEGLQRTLRQSGLRTVVAKSDAAELLVPTAEKLSVVMAFLRGTL